MLIKLVICHVAFRTITPIRVSHEMVLQVFFSVDGEDLQGNPMEGDDHSGVMRMLVLAIPTVLPSVSHDLLFDGALLVYNP